MATVLVFEEGVLLLCVLMRLSIYELHSNSSQRFLLCLKTFLNKIEILFCFKLIYFYIFNLFYSIDIKNNFLKIKKYYFNIF
jgi:hypothetical protein